MPGKAVLLPKPSIQPEDMRETIVQPIPPTMRQVWKIRPKSPSERLSHTSSIQALPKKTRSPDWGFSTSSAWLFHYKRTRFQQEPTPKESRLQTNSNQKPSNRLGLPSIEMEALRNWVLQKDLESSNSFFQTFQELSINRPSDHRSWARLRPTRRIHMKTKL